MSSLGMKTIALSQKQTQLNLHFNLKNREVLTDETNKYVNVLSTKQMRLFNVKKEIKESKYRRKKRYNEGGLDEELDSVSS